MTMFKVLVVLVFLGLVSGLPQYTTKEFKVGIEYDHSSPMVGGSDRYRHRNNYEPFFVTVTASAKNGFVISYIEVKAITDAEGEVEFSVLRGQTGSKEMVFQLVSNNSEFLTYSYLAYGIREEEYKKVANIITLPTNKNDLISYSVFMIFLSAVISFMSELLNR